MNARAAGAGPRRGARGWGEGAAKRRWPCFAAALRSHPPLRGTSLRTPAHARSAWAFDRARAMAVGRTPSPRKWEKGARMVAFRRLLGSAPLRGSPLEPRLCRRYLPGRRSWHLHRGAIRQTRRAALPVPVDGACLHAAAGPAHQRRHRRFGRTSLDSTVRVGANAARRQTARHTFGNKVVDRPSDTSPIAGCYGFRCFVRARHARDSGDASGPGHRRSRREPKGAPVDRIAWRDNIHGIARMTRSCGPPAACLGRSHTIAAGQTPRCSAIKPNFTSTPWRSRSRFLWSR